MTKEDKEFFNILSQQFFEMSLKQDTEQGKIFYTEMAFIYQNLEEDSRHEMRKILKKQFGGYYND